jgi:hypothetical protein
VTRALPVLLTLLTAATGCSSTGFSGEDVRLRARGDTLYVLARSSDVSRGFCASLGGDVAKGRRAPIQSGTTEPGRVPGCDTVRRIIVCPDEDRACLAHEERHRAEGAFHP